MERFGNAPRCRDADPKPPMQSNARECKVLKWISDVTFCNQAQHFLFFTTPPGDPMY
jgi:hypothetical protein